MKFKYFTLIFFLLSCTNNAFEKSNVSSSKISNGFALIYKESDFENNIISSKLNSDKIEAAHNKYKKNTSIADQIFETSKLENKNMIELNNNKESFDKIFGN